MAQVSVSTTVSPLAGSIADPQGGLISTGTEYRRYRAAINVGIPDHGRYYQERRPIFYEVGRRFATIGEALGRHAEEAVPIDASVDLNPAQAANFEGFARKYSNFAPQWVKMDLAGLAERLARGIAAQSVYGGVTTAHLRGGRPLRVVALGTLDSPQTASTASVFIPRTVDTVGGSDVFAVLVAAANGEGANVTTDVVRLDANSNSPLVPSVEGHHLAGACVSALRIVGANMEESGAGDLFAYAVTRGIHQVVSVVAHTDEGGITRSLLRSDSFRVPYGGIDSTIRHYPGLPALAGLGKQFSAAWVDSIALKTAALVGHCDPLTPGEGGMYPTVFTATGTAVAEPGVTGPAVTAAQARTVGRQLAGDIVRFAEVYMPALTRLFALQSYSGVAAQHYAAAAGHVLTQGEDRHLQMATVAPYFWVEPTSLIPSDFAGSAAERHGFGAKVTPGHVKSAPCFERVRELTPGGCANHTYIAFKMRTARTSDLVCAFTGAPSSLVDLQLMQFDEASVALPGDQGPTSGTVAAKHAAAAPLSSYLWVRGQSPLPAPAEFINTNSNYGARYKTVTWSDDGDATVSDLPDAHELTDSPITWRVSVPTGLANGPSNYADREARRARSRAATALSQAIARSRAFGVPATPTMSVSNVPPTFDDIPTAPPPDPAGLLTHSGDPGPSLGLAEPNPPHVRVTNQPAAPVALVALHEPVRAPPPPSAANRGPGVGAPVAAAAMPPAPAAGPPLGPAAVAAPANAPPAAAGTGSVALAGATPTT